MTTTTEELTDAEIIADWIVNGNLETARLALAEVSHSTVLDVVFAVSYRGHGEYRDALHHALETVQGLVS